jgi:hypothetical protein
MPDFEPLLYSEALGNFENSYNHHIRVEYRVVFQEDVPPFLYKAMLAVPYQADA